MKQGLEQDRLSFEERCGALENLVSAALIISDVNATEAEKERAREARDQSCDILYGKSWEEAKEQALKEMGDKLQKNNNKE